MRREGSVKAGADYKDDALITALAIVNHEHN